MKKAVKILVALCLALNFNAHSQNVLPKSKGEIFKINQYKTTMSVPVLSTELIASAGEIENEKLKALMLEVPNNQQFVGKRIAIIATDGVEELELTIPYKYYTDRGAKVELLSPRIPNFPDKFGLTYPEIRKTHILTVHFMENSGWVKIDKFIDEAQTNDYDAFIVPGGAWNPDAMRVNTDAIRLVKEANLQKKPLLSLCHGVLLFVNAEIVKGRQMSSFWNIQKDLENAGAIWKDNACVVDANMITGRYPFDLPDLINAFSKQLKNK
jgi:protease I